MLKKQGIIVLLVGANLLLLATLIIVAAPMPAAHAQQAAGGRAGDFLTVSAKPLGQSYDVIYILDVPQRKLHTFFPENTQTKFLRPAPPVDLAEYFRTQGNTP